ncbi:MAG: Amuc_1100 family pilus-like protein [Verrucomicrobiota bacterium]
MKWLQHNVFSAIALIVVCGALSLAFVFLTGRLARQRQISRALVHATQDLERLMLRDPGPTPANIQAARREGERVRQFVGQVEKHFASAEYPSDLNNMTLRAYLDTTIGRLRAQAHLAGVEIPTNYWFGFEAQKGTVDFSSGSLQPLALEVAEVNTVCHVLFDAKVNALEGIKRVPVVPDEAEAGGDFLQTTATTNATAILVPYEITFQGFSSELAAVLDGVARLPQCFIVTNLVVSPVEKARAQPETVNAYRLLPPAHDGPPVRNDRLHPWPLAKRPPVAVPPPTGPAPFLSEKLLQFTVSIQSVRLRHPEHWQTAVTATSRRLR